MFYELSSKYFFSLKDADSEKMELLMKRNPRYIENFYSNNFDSEQDASIDVRVFAGKNGSGKTFLLNQIFKGDGFFVLEDNNEKIACVVPPYNGLTNYINVELDGKQIPFIEEMPKKIRRILFSNSLEASKTAMDYSNQEEIIDGEEKTNKNEYVYDLTTVSKLLNTENYIEMIEEDVLEQINFINLLDDKDRNVVENLLDLPKKISIELPNIKDMKFLYHSIFNFLEDSQLVKDFFLLKDENLGELQQSLIIESKKSFIFESLKKNDYESVIKGMDSIYNPKMNETIYEEENGEDYSIEQMIKRYRKSLDIINSLNNIEISSKNSEKIIFEIPIKDNKKFFKDVSEKESHFIKLKKPYWTNISSGQYCFLNLFGRINAAVADKKKNDYVLTMILIDEVDLGLHPAWQRKWMKHVPIILSKIFKETPIQLVISTHSPVILSDVLDKDVHLIGSNTSVQGICDFKTFGNNIHELMADQFFLDEGVIGDFAKNRINTIIKELRDQEVEEEKLNKYEIVAEAIGEPVIKKEVDRLLLENRESNLDTDSDTVYDKEFDDFKGFIKDIKNELKSTVFDNKESDLNEKDRD